ncbi:MAG: acyl-homoserine-lactone synthase [Allosphingosinicella sp.]
MLEGRYEVDHFDDAYATYLIVACADGRHAGSARLPGTTRPHILDTLFPGLCAAPPPRGPGILEITRFCLGRGCNPRDRLQTRNILLSALALRARERSPRLAHDGSRRRVKGSGAVASSGLAGALTQTFVISTVTIPGTHARRSRSPQPRRDRARVASTHGNAAGPGFASTGRRPLESFLQLLPGIRPNGLHHAHAG